MKNTKVIAVILCTSMAAGIAGCTTVETSASLPETTVATTEAVQESESETEAAPVIADSGVDYLAGHQKFEVTSTDLVDGVWADVISSTSRGNNVSPALKWEAVDGASEYIIYMIDMNTTEAIACGSLHWKSGGITVTELPQGWAPSIDFAGPRPPAGVTHIYEIYVVALKEPVDRLKGSVRAVNPKFESFINELDTDSEGNTGNILAYGKISGTYTG